LVGDLLIELFGGDEILYRLGHPPGAQGAVLFAGQLRQPLVGRYDLATDTVLFQLALDVLDTAGVLSDVPDATSAKTLAEVLRIPFLPLFILVRGRDILRTSLVK
jgi:hypothetical protein